MSVNTPKSPESNNDKYSKPIPTPYENDNIAFYQTPNQQPITNQETIYNNPTPENKKGLSKKAIAVIASLLGVSIAAATLFGINSGNKNIPNSPVATSPANPAEKPVETINPHLNLEQRVDQYKNSVEKYKAMSVDEFETLPLNERLIYSEYIIDDTTNMYYDYVYSNDRSKYAIDYTPVSLDNTGQEIIDNFLYVKQIAILQGVNDRYTYDPINGIKVLSNIYYDIGTNGPLITQDYLDCKEARQSQKSPDFLMNIFTAINTSEITDITSCNGEKLRGKIVQFKTNDDTILYASFTCHKYKSYFDEEKSVWLLVKQESDLESLK